MTLPIFPTLLSGLVAKVPDSQVLADLDHVASWASRNGGDAHQLMITGFCWGGRITWLYAAHNPQLKAAAAWYGKLVGDKTSTRQNIPLISQPILMPPFWDFMAARTPAFRKIPLKQCARRYAPPMLKQKSWSIPMPDMRSTPIIARAITKSPRKTVGRECWSGSCNTVGRNKR